MSSSLKTPLSTTSKTLSSSENWSALSRCWVGQWSLCSWSVICGRRSWRKERLEEVVAEFCWKLCLSVSVFFFFHFPLSFAPLPPLFALSPSLIHPALCHCFWMCWACLDIICVCPDFKTQVQKDSTSMLPHTEVIVYICYLRLDYLLRRPLDSHPISLMTIDGAQGELTWGGLSQIEPNHSPLCASILLWKVSFPSIGNWAKCWHIKTHHKSRYK